MMAVMIVLFKAELEADDWSGHGGGEAEGQWIVLLVEFLV